jgi:hypothetical protein
LPIEAIETKLAALCRRSDAAPGTKTNSFRRGY